MADIDFNDVRRNIKLGMQTRVAQARPQGSNASFFLNAGYDFELGKFAVGPVAALTAQNVEVNGFDESFAGAAGLRIGPQKRRSEVGSFGVRASWNLGDIVPYARFTADKERKNDERLVTATPLSLAPSGNSYDLPAYASDSSYTTFVVGVRGTVDGWFGYGINYVKVSGRSGIKEDSLSGTVSYRF